MPKFITYMCVVVFILQGACKKEDLYVPVCDGSSPTFDVDIKPIIRTYCQASNCHGFGSKWGDFSTYVGFGPLFTNGDFEERVITTQQMPRGTSLTHEQLDLIQCWIDDGYPEK